MDKINEKEIITLRFKQFLATYEDIMKSVQNENTGFLKSDISKTTRITGSLKKLLMFESELQGYCLAIDDIFGYSPGTTQERVWGAMEMTYTLPAEVDVDQAFHEALWKE